MFQVDASKKPRYNEADERYTPEWVADTIVPVLLMLSAAGYEFVECFPGPEDYLGKYLRSQGINIESLKDVDFFEWVNSKEVSPHPINISNS